MAEANPLGRPLRIVFFGTPAFAVQSLDALAKESWIEIAAVYTQGDKPAGRGRRPQPTPVKVAALAAGIPVSQPASLADQETIRAIRKLQPDLLVVVAYGGKLPGEVLKSAPYGALNVHASLLPKYRGAAPIQRAIQAGEPVTGITIMQMDTGMDTGPIVLQKALAIGIQDTAETLHDQLAELGGELLIAACRRLLQGTILPVEQAHDRASYAPKLRKEDGRIDWSRRAHEVHNHIRAMHPWPGAFFDWSPLDSPGTLRLQVFPGELGPLLEASAAPGSIDYDASNERLRIACQDRYYLVAKLKPASGKAMSAKAFQCGYLETCRGPGTRSTGSKP